MNIDEYEHIVDRTAIYPGQGAIDGLVYTVLGLTGEAGEIANKVKKIIRDDDWTITEERTNDLIDELGDVLWYVVALARELNTDLWELTNRNGNKLLDRLDRNVLRGSGDSR